MRKNKPVIKATLQLRAASAINESPTLWAIENYLPCHHLSAIVAPTGAGLTTLAAQICAHLAPAPSIQTTAKGTSQTHPARPTVLFLPGRESIYSTRDRLLAAGVDLAQVLILENVAEDYTDEYRQSNTLRPVNTSDHKRISQVLRENKSIRLVLIDNAEDLFTVTNRPSRNKLLRLLACFQQVAEHRELAITFLTAIPSLQRDPLRSTFLSALHHVCRAIYLLAPAPQEDTSSSSIKNQNPKIKNPSAQSQFANRNSKILFPLKNTLAAPSTLRIADRFDPQATIGLTYRGYLAAIHAPKRTGPSPDSRNYAIEFLREILKPGQSLPVGSLHDPEPGTIHYLAQQAGITHATVARAKEQLGITASRDQERWYWHNPADADPQLSESQDAQNSAPSPETCTSSRKSAIPEPPFPPVLRQLPLVPGINPDASHPTADAPLVKAPVS